MAFDVISAALSDSLVVTPLGSPLHPWDDVESLTGGNHVQQIHKKSKMVVEKSKEREVGS